MVRWLVLFFVFSWNSGFADHRHSYPSLPTNIDPSSFSSGFENPEKDTELGAIMLRRYDDTRQLAQLIGARFDQNFVDKAFDFYSKHGLLKDNPTVTETDIREFLREVGGVENNEMLVKVGKAFVEQKKEEFLGKAPPAENKPSNDTLDSANTDTNRSPQEGKLSEILPNLGPKPNEASAPQLANQLPTLPISPLASGIQSVPSAPQIVEKPTTILPNQTEPVEKVVPLAAATTPSLIPVFTAPESPISLPSVKNSSAEEPLLKWKESFTSNQKSNSQTSEKVNSDNFTKDSSDSFTSKLFNSEPAKAFSSGTIADKIPTPQGTPSVVVMASSPKTNPVVEFKNQTPSNQNSNNPVIPPFSKILTAKEADSKPRIISVDTLTSTSGGGTTSSTDNTSTVIFVPAAGKRPLAKEDTQPSSIVDKFYRFFQNTIPETKKQPERVPTYFEPSISQASTVPHLIEPKIEQVENAKYFILPVVLSVIAAIWLAWRVSESRRRFSRVEVLENPDPQIRNLN